MKLFGLLAIAVALPVTLSSCSWWHTRSGHSGQGTLGNTSQIAEAFLTPLNRTDEVDSVTTWVAPDGKTWLIASAKASNQLLVYDAENGALLRRFGERGNAPGQFRRPNGVAVFADYLFVVERDNHRVQVLRLPDFVAVATFGEQELRNPYGLWLRQTDADTLMLYVTDSFMADYQTEQAPALAQLDQRIKRYRVLIDDDVISAGYIDHFGDTSEPAALRMVESIAGDPANDRVLIAEEDTRIGSTLRVYTLGGQFTGKSISPAKFTAQAEGVALWQCPDGSGFWLAADQLRGRTVFNVFDRTTLAYHGRFSGHTVAMTDGITMNQAANTQFPNGALYATHDDQGVAAFDWRDIAAMLHLPVQCPP